jgi:hypothetical protein
MDLNDFQKELNETNTFYSETKNKISELMKPCEAKASELEKVVESAFSDFLKKIGPLINCDGESKAEVTKFRVYSHYSDGNFGLRFNIHVESLKVSDGEEISDNTSNCWPERCPHIYFDKLDMYEDQKVWQFMRDYHITQISPPHNTCEHK